MSTNVEMKKVAAIGLGYVGLPLATLCAKKSYSVVGLESSEAVVCLMINE
jgi:UDP-N-acetyl-D-mannosaminuronate dehydrogenase